MKGFKLDENGDIIIENGKILMTEGKDLIRQTVQTVLQTNKKEWFLNENEGINFDNILTKNPDFDVIRNEIAEGIKQVDETFIIQEFDYNFDREKRNLKINFTARNKDGEEITGEYIY